MDVFTRDTILKFLEAMRDSHDQRFQAALDKDNPEEILFHKSASQTFDFLENIFQIDDEENLRAYTAKIIADKK